MKFSIIIACYNLGELVCHALDSCLNQKDVTSDNYEVIVINDGSEDNTLEYIQRYSQYSNVRIINKPNGGLSQTRNLGLAEARGEYVLFLDGDDWYTDDALATISQYCSNYNVVIFPMYYYYSNHNYNTNLVGLKQGEYLRETFLHQTLGKKQFSIIPAQKKAYRRDFLIQNELRFVEGILHEDNPFFLDVMDKCEKLFYIDKALYYYRQNRDGSITSKHTRKNFEGVITGLQHINNLSIERNPDVRFLNGNMLVFQATQKYSNVEDKVKAYSYLRHQKKIILKYMMTSTFDMANFIRLLLLLLDPVVLRLFYI